jgi:heme/copper-type cytochrome/quinol oxidase subunit 2
MLNEILFVAAMFITRLVLPVLFMLVLGEWIARRAERHQPAKP